MNGNNNDQKASPIQAQEFLKEVDYPATKEEIIEAARDQGADENVISTLERIPMDSFNSPNDVAEGIGKIE